MAAPNWEPKSAIDMLNVADGAAPALVTLVACMGMLRVTTPPPVVMVISPAKVWPGA